ncbi:MAG TPA: hypothetical protein VFO19_22110, partial [Vicinamibacterales bacterium]|nr:hypothetical protein [Vicinamibacterales bacterium]
MLGDRTRFGEVEVARERTLNEIALNILLAVLTLIFLLVVVTLQPFAAYAGTAVPIPVLIPLLVCLISHDHRDADLGPRRPRDPQGSGRRGCGLREEQRRQGVDGAAGDHRSH